MLGLLGKKKAALLKCCGRGADFLWTGRSEAARSGVGTCRRKPVPGRDGENLALAVSSQPLDPISPERHLAFSATTQHRSFMKPIRVELLVTCTLKCLFPLKLCILVKTFRWQGKTLHGFLRSNLKTMVSISSLFRCLKYLNVFKALCVRLGPSAS